MDDKVQAGIGSLIQLKYWGCDRSQTQPTKAATGAVKSVRSKAPGSG